MILELAHPTREDIDLLKRQYSILEDWRVNAPEIAQAMHDATIFYAVVDGENLAGYLWIEGFDERVPELGCSFGALVHDRYRGNSAIGKRSWREDVADEIQLVLGMAFEDLRVPRIEATFERRHGFLEKFYTRLGFAFEGTRANGAIIMGVRRKLAVMGLTEEMFKEVGRASLSSAASDSSR